MKRRSVTDCDCQFEIFNLNIDASASFHGQQIISASRGWVGTVYDHNCFSTRLAIDAVTVTSNSSCSS